MTSPPPPPGTPWDPSQGAPPPYEPGHRVYPPPPSSQEPDTAPINQAQPPPVQPGQPPAQPGQQPGQWSPPPYEGQWSQAPLPSLQPGFEQQAPPPPQQQYPVKKKRKILPLVAIIVGAVVVLGASVYFGVNWLNKDKDGDPAVAGPSPSQSAVTDQGVRTVDLKNAKVYIKGELTAFKEGKAGDFVVSAKDPVYADLDGDGDEDAAALVEYAGSAAQPWSQILIWIWDGKEARPIAFEASWQWGCGTLPPLAMSAGKGGLSVVRSVANVCGGDAATETITVAMAGNVPVEVIGPHHSATTRCRVAPAAASAVADVTGKAEPLALNASNAPKLAQAGEVSKLEVHHQPKPDTKLDNGYAIAVITWADGQPQGCGWVPWSAVTG
ncbi:hypothetical protein Afil01_68700 [Actinorhabdospora filicis]|uniref:Uncharacterized protein n=1 Tax=Actinorhabdospora filicis TaxID=1785913 RepID=A0A9W6SU23_9ACTN|nr:hypothetical protein [Actinorhabdospora filicis]GLZ82063.1 hypothetical protein Afil01_68700 [Actinorhabdospora filicis]